MNPYTHNDLIEIIGKLPKNITSLEQAATLSFNEFTNAVKEKQELPESLTILESIHTAIIEEVSHDRLAKNKNAFTPSNPDLNTAVGFSTESDYKKLSQERDKNHNFATEGAINSLFSPVAYLTQLYAHALTLHPTSSHYHLNNRRPDLANLVLSKNNLNKKISTLSLSNTILLHHLDQSEKEATQTLASWRYSSELPYHRAYESIHQIISQRDPNYLSFIDTQHLLGGDRDEKYLKIFQAMVLHLSPDVDAMISENLDEDEGIEALFNKNFGANKEKILNNATSLADYYSITPALMSSFLFCFPIDFNQDEIKKPLLILNKAIRLYQATEFSPQKIKQLVEKIDQGKISQKILTPLFLIKVYQARYKINFCEAMILARVDISLQEAKQCGAIEMAEQNNDLPHFSQLLAKVHGLTHNELMMLLHCLKNDTHPLPDIDKLIDFLQDHTNGVETTPLRTPDSHNLMKIIELIEQITRWLRAQKWSIAELYYMTINDYPDQTTPEISHFVITIITLRSERLDLIKETIQTINQQKTGSTSAAARQQITTALKIEKEKLKKELIKEALIAITTVFQLPTTAWANYLLERMKLLYPPASPAEDCWEKITDLSLQHNNTDNAEIQIPPNLITYCHQLAQLSLICQHLLFNDDSTLLALQSSNYLSQIGLAITPSLQALQSLTHLKHWLATLGDDSATALDALKAEKSLTINQWAMMMKMNPTTLNQAAQQLTPPLTHFSHFSHIDAALKWVNAARSLGIAPLQLSQLLSLSDNGYRDNSRISANTDQQNNYPLWKTVADDLMAGLPTTAAQRIQRQANLEERFSTGLCSLAIAQSSSTLSLAHPDDLYQYLLIDNQVSAAVETTPILEAITSIQLYVNRTLQGLEGQADPAAVNHVFFTRWDSQNKGYSDWHAAVMLAYYPENYLNPSQRIGQSKMMDNFLQSINQSALSRETVEDAFKAYLANFEKIANLSIISAYHDHITIDEGLTYFIGTDPSNPNRYYWRTVDHQQMKNGKFSAHAWSEWQEINCPANPLHHLIRPVVHQTRLYLVWLEHHAGVEQAVISSSSASKASKADSVSLLAKRKGEYQLKIAQLGYDNNWSAVISYPVTSNLFNNTNKLSLYCARVVEKNHFIVVPYIKEIKLQGEYWTISDDMQCKQGKFNTAQEFIEKNKETDKENIIRINNANFESYDYIFNAHQFSLFKIKNNTGFLLSCDGCFYIYHINKNNFSVKTQIEISFDSKNHSIRDLLNDIMIKIAIKDNKREYNINSESNKIIMRAERIVFTLDEMTFSVEENYFIHNKSYIPFTFEIRSKSGNTYEKITSNIPITRKKNTGNNIIEIYQAPNGAQYLAWQHYRVRLNTLFAKQLINLANKGIDQVLKLDTQKIKEPQLGDGFYAEFILPQYNEAQHGAERWFEISIQYDNENWLNFSSTDSTILIDNNLDHAACYRETLNDSKETKCILFFPYNTNYDLDIKIKVRFYNNNEEEPAIFSYNPETKKYQLKNIIDRNEYTGFKQVTVLTHIGSPEHIDFSGANALYFWELFYYVPMSVMHHFLQEQQFYLAHHWLKYIYNPAGYHEQQQFEKRHWNVLPLLQDISWNEHDRGRLDSNDPDVIAQNDPMHYKIAVLMSLIELLIKRGDVAYRKQTREGNTEAKMWYIQAMAILGKKSTDTLQTGWSVEQLEQDDRNKPPAETGPKLKTIAEKLPPLCTQKIINPFLPQEHGRINAYRHELSKNLYNLRHGLTLEGQKIALPLFELPSDPNQLNKTQGENVSWIKHQMGLHRFPIGLEQARSMVSTLMQFGASLLSINERRDAEALNLLLQTQANALMTASIEMQDKTLEELKAEGTILHISLASATARLENYSLWYDQHVSADEKHAMDLRAEAALISHGSKGLYTAAAALDMFPNIFGMAAGGCRWGALGNALAMSSELAASVKTVEADKIYQSELYRRRREEWGFQRDNSEWEKKQLEAQIKALDIRLEAAKMQKNYLQQQQKQTQAQLNFLQNKFSNKALYSWMQNRLMAIYHQFYDQTVARCLMAEQAYYWETQERKSIFIKPLEAWQKARNGLLSGESLMLNLAKMESAYLAWDARALEVERTVSLAMEYQKLAQGSLVLKETLDHFFSEQTPETIPIGSRGSQLSVENNILKASISLADLKLMEDYPKEMNLGTIRRIKQISVSLPMLLAPYQDIQATLSFVGDSAQKLAKGCTAIAISRGMNDSGQFQLDFNDGKYLPFEGININDSGVLVLSFPNVHPGGKQRALLRHLSDIILHVRYSIRY